MYPTPAGEAFQQNGVWYQDYNVQNETTGQIEVRRYMHNGTEWILAPEMNLKADLTKNIPSTPSGIDLKKHVVSLDKCLVNLGKDKQFSFDNHRAKVAVVLDVSLSMSSLIRGGAVQKIMNRLAPLALRFDDNGELDVWIFATYCDRMEGMTLNNFENYVKDCILNSRSKALWGGTSYAPAIRDVVKKYSQEEPSEYPAFIIYITDGSNCDERDTNKAIIDSSYTNNFFQFIGIGSSMFRYLEKLDDLPGRPVDNTGFIKVSDMSKMSDEQLYNSLLDQYTDWLKVKGLR